MTDTAIQQPVNTTELLESFEEWKREMIEAGEPLCAGGFCNGEDVQLTWSGGALCFDHRVRDGYARVDVYPEGAPYEQPGFSPEEPATTC